MPSLKDLQAWFDEYNPPPVTVPAQDNGQMPPMSPQGRVRGYGVGTVHPQITPWAARFPAPPQPLKLTIPRRGQFHIDGPPPPQQDLNDAGQPNAYRVDPKSMAKLKNDENVRSEYRRYLAEHKLSEEDINEIMKDIVATQNAGN